MALTLDVGREPLPGYRLVRLLGEGGFGQVWQATAPGGVQVALKFIRLDTYQATPELRALEVVKNIRHPHLLDIQFATRVDDRLVLAMALCDRSLWDRFEECREQGLPGIPVDELLEYMQDAAKALDYLNEVRHVGDDGRKVAVAHRDIKPHNIFLVGGSVKLADFGLVKALEQSAATNTGSMTPAYAAPELFSRSVSPRSDQWSLAVTYYQVRTSLLPFTGSMHEMMFAILQQDPDLGAVPPEERAVLGQALEKDPQNRWASCRAMVKALERAVPSRSSATLAGTGGTGVGATDLGGWGSENPTVDASRRGREHKEPGNRFETRSPLQASAETNQSPPKSAPPAIQKFSAKTETPSLTQDIFDRPTVYLDRKDLLPRPQKGPGSKSTAAAGGAESSGRRKLFAAFGVLFTACALAVGVYFSTRRDDDKADPEATQQVVVDDSTPPVIEPAKVVSSKKDDSPVKVDGPPSKESDIKTGIVATSTLKILCTPADLELQVRPDAKISGTGAERTIQIEGIQSESTLTIEATLKGYRKESQRIVLQRGESKSVEISLEPMPAVMTVEVEPADASLEVRGGSAKVSVDGSQRTIEVANADEDLALTLYVSKKGYRSRNQEWKPKAAENRRIKIALEPYPAVLTIEVEPTEAQIRVVEGVATITGAGKVRRVEVVKPATDALVILLVSRQGWKEERIEWNPQPGANERRQIPLRRASIAKELRDSIGMQLVLIPAGDFQMGSHETPEELANSYQLADASSFADEQPPHHVILSRPIYMGKCEVTVGQFRAFVRATGYKTEGEADAAGGQGWNDKIAKSEISPKFDWLSTGYQQSDEHPVVNVTYKDALAFCEWLSEKEKAVVRLPTEAEWEYACRAGTTRRYPFGEELDSVVAFANTADATAKGVLSTNNPGWLFNERADGFVFTAPVGSFRANAFGLYDTIGNVWEWCGDYYAADYYQNSPENDPMGPNEGTERVVRGGGWTNTAWHCRSCQRLAVNPSSRSFGIGFRVVRLPAEE